MISAKVDEVWATIRSRNSLLHLGDLIWCEAILRNEMKDKGIKNKALHNRNVIKALTSILPPNAVKGRVTEFFKHFMYTDILYMTFLDLTMRKVPRRAELS